MSNMNIYIYIYIHTYTYVAPPGSGPASPGRPRGAARRGGASRQELNRQLNIITDRTHIKIKRKIKQLTITT